MTAVACSVYSAKLIPAWTGEGPRGEGAPAGGRQGYQPMCEVSNHAAQDGWDPTDEGAPTSGRQGTQGHTVDGALHGQGSDAKAERSCRRGHHGCRL